MNPENEFIPGCKVSLTNKYGVVLPRTEINEMIGLIRWDSPKENDIEDWRGVLGTFKQIGGKIISNNYQFTYINDDGTLKKI